MSIGPKVAVSNVAPIKKPEPPKEQATAFMAAPLPKREPAVIPHRVSREIGTLLTFIAGLVLGVILTLVATTSMLDPWSKALFTHDVAQHIYHTTDGQ